MKKVEKTPIELINIYKSYNYKILDEKSNIVILVREYGGTEENKRFIKTIIIDKNLHSFTDIIEVKAIPNRPVPDKYKKPRQKKYQLKNKGISDNDSSKKVLFKK